MRPFDLEAAKRGEPVCTRDGKPARIICTDYCNEPYPIVALIKAGDGECVRTFAINGVHDIEKRKEYEDMDIMMVNDESVPASEPVPDPEADEKENASGFYMVYLEGGRGPTYKHPSYVSAYNEAARLSIACRSEAYILRAVQQVRIKLTVLDLGDPDAPVLPF